MRVGLGIDELGIDADAVARPPDASFEYIADTQLATDLLCVDKLKLALPAQSPPKITTAQIAPQPPP
jgi:hypothetical protein